MNTSLLTAAGKTSVDSCAPSRACAPGGNAVFSPPGKVWRFAAWVPVLMFAVAAAGQSARLSIQRYLPPASVPRVYPEPVPILPIPYPAPQPRGQILPSTRIVNAGGSATFTVTAVGVPPLGCQWLFNGADIAGATSGVLTLTNVQPDQAGLYTVRLTSPLGTNTTPPARLLVRPPIVTCVPAPVGLVSWWPADGNANDIVSGNNGVLNDVTFAPGMVGQAFSFNGTNSFISVRNARSLNPRSGLTIEGWIYPTRDGYQGILSQGMSFYPGGYEFDTISGGGLSFQVAPSVLPVAVIPSTRSLTVSGVLTTDAWNYVAATYDSASGIQRIYVNGMLAGSATNAPAPIPGNTNPITIGVNSAIYPPIFRPRGYFQGEIDELSLYNRALSAAEIQAIYQAGAAGKCRASILAPKIVSQPRNQVAPAGGTATFSVSASGTPPLRYQWLFNDGPLSGQTNPVLALTGVQPGDAGDYSVRVSNYFGSVVSSNATLTVLASATNCVPPPAGLVSWWRGEGNTLDSIGTNNGIASGNLTYGPGEVGQTFVFDGTSSITVPASPSLNVKSFTIEGWINPVDVSTQEPIVEYGSGATWSGVHFWISVPEGGGPGVLFANLRSLSSGLDENILSSAPGLVKSNQWSHVALTFDQASGLAQLFLDGTNVASRNLGSISPDTAQPFNIGLRPPGIESGGGTRFVGEIDELSLYDRALSPSEIQAIYEAGAAGKCPSSPPPPLTNCVPTPSGIVSWWPAEGNADDIIGGNNGVFSNGVAFAPGVVGQAFSFNGSNSFVEVPNSPSLVLTNALTIEFWARRQDLNSYGYVLNKGGDWTRGQLNYGVDLAPGQFNYVLAFLFAGGVRQSVSIADTNWHYFAIVARNGDMDPTFYVDGVQAPVTEREGSATINLYPSTEPLHIGAQVDPISGWNYYSKDQIDELSIYNRALSATEIQAIYNAGSAGKCPPTPPNLLPTITTQLTNQTVTVGGTASFSVTAGGTPPLSYQWLFNNGPLAGQTNPVLTLANVQPTNAGDYSVMVSNLFGGVLSSNATLTVVPLPTNCVPPPSGIVSWWPAEGNADDIIGGNNGVLSNGVSFVPGVVGQAFSFNGSNSFVEVPNSPSLVLTNALTIEFWARRQDLNSYGYVLNKGGDWTRGQLNYAVDLAPGQFNYVLAFLFAGGVRQSVSIADTNWHYFAIVARNGDVDPAFYVDGVQEPVTEREGSATINLYPSMEPLHIGAQVDPISGWNYYSKDQIDELSIYNRALSASEIQGIYNAGPAGKCPPTPLNLLPTITTQPTNQTVTVGETASFSILAYGTPPLNYQWLFDDDPLVDQTNPVLTLVNVQPTNAGVYSVLVSNVFGGARSSNATLTVVPPLATNCVPAPAGIVGWWPAEANADDIIGGNNGVLSNGVSFVPGVVGQAFDFNGSNSFVEVPNSPSLVLTNALTIEFWARRQDLNSYGYVLNKGGDWSRGQLNYGVDLAPADFNNVFAFLFAGGVRQSISIADTNWHYFAVVARNGDVDPTFYVDGVQEPVTEREGSPTINLYPSSEPLHIGAQVDPISGWNYYSKDQIDELSIYNRALSASEIQAIYQAGAAGKCRPATLNSAPPANQVVVPGGGSLIQRRADGSILLHFGGIPGRTYRIQYTESLSNPHWQDLGSETADGVGDYQLTDSPPADAPTRYYRAVSP